MTEPAGHFIETSSHLRHSMSLIARILNPLHDELIRMHNLKGLYYAPSHDDD